MSSKATMISPIVIALSVLFVIGCDAKWTNRNHCSVYGDLLFAHGVFIRKLTEKEVAEEARYQSQMKHYRKEAKKVCEVRVNEESKEPLTPVLPSFCHRYDITKFVFPTCYVLNDIVYVRGRRVYKLTTNETYEMKEYMIQSKHHDVYLKNKWKQDVGMGPYVNITEVAKPKVPDVCGKRDSITTSTTTTTVSNPSSQQYPSYSTSTASPPRQQFQTYHYSTASTAGQTSQQNSASQSSASGGTNSASQQNYAYQYSVSGPNPASQPNQASQASVNSASTPSQQSQTRQPSTSYTNPSSQPSTSQTYPSSQPSTNQTYPSSQPSTSQTNPSAHQYPAYYYSTTTTNRPTPHYEPFTYSTRTV